MALSYPNRVHRNPGYDDHIFPYQPPLHPLCHLQIGPDDIKFIELALCPEHKLRNPEPKRQSKAAGRLLHHHKDPIHCLPKDTLDVPIYREPIDLSMIEDRMLPDTSVASSTNAEESGAGDVDEEHVEIARKRKNYGKAITKPKRNTPSIYKFPKPQNKGIENGKENLYEDKRKTGPPPDPGLSSYDYQAQEKHPFDLKVSVTAKEGEGESESECKGEGDGE